MNLSIRHCVIVLTFGLTACASAPVHYYTLLEPVTTTSPALPPASFLIDVLPIGVPAQLDQPQWVARQGDSGIAVLDGERWAAPLSDELRAALSAQLVQRLGTLDIAGLPQPINTPVLRIKLQVHRFDAWPGQTVQLDADWSLGYADDVNHVHLICRGQFNETAPGGYPELARAEQRAVGKLAIQIAEDASGWTRANQAKCSSMTSLISSRR
ncbi:PqiC family protein [Rhodanobacter sp. A1T4]|uniref:PqiC family protein n=1 Tax=Rhodanobacter sp. A1T4 TaxID=2723087 RepID=UPI00161FBE31|nr:PqiC family protein [Rhodanobacter sp. A1T4]MBB6245053.1 hypothetical protein [Rhodanobacter sp. A1T4]